MQDLTQVREDFWGKDNERAPSAAQRRVKLNALLNSAWSKNDLVFTYRIGKQIVCENSFLRAIGNNNI